MMASSRLGPGDVPLLLTFDPGVPPTEQMIIHIGLNAQKNFSWTNISKLFSEKKYFTKTSLNTFIKQLIILCALGFTIFLQL